MNHKILIFGNGFIGSRLHEGLECDVTEKRIYKLEDAQQEIDKYSPQIIINCIGFTGKNNVDDCEEDKNKTLTSNVFVPVILAEAALRNKIKLIHISSGCIYHFNHAKDKPITEDKAPDFYELFYSRTKIYAESILKNLLNKTSILIPRIRIPLDNKEHPRNILTKLINYKRVINIPNSVTYIPDFIQALKHLIKIDAEGIYNIVNNKGLRYPELLQLYEKYVPDFQYEIISEEELYMVRTNLILSTKKLKSTGFEIRNIHDVLEECIEEYLA